VESPLLEIRFSLTPRDFGRAVQRFILRRFSKTLREVGICGLIVLPLLVWVAATRASGHVAVYLLAGVLLLLVLPIFYLSFVWGRRGKQLMGQAPLPPTIVWRFGNSKVEVGDGSTFEAALWDRWIGFLDAGDYILMFLSKEQFQIIPKRAFQSPTDLETLRALLKSKFSRESRK
jgi:hypothetical protein